MSGEDAHSIVVYENGAWWYWDEVWSNKHGPFETEEEAKADLKRYVEWLNGESPR